MASIETKFAVKFFHCLNADEVSTLFSPLSIVNGIFLVLGGLNNEAANKILKSLDIGKLLQIIIFIKKEETFGDKSFKSIQGELSSMKKSKSQFFKIGKMWQSK